MLKAKSWGPRIGMAILVALSPVRIWADGPVDGKDCAQSEVIGRVVNQSYSSLDQEGDKINMDVQWRLKVRVKSVLWGHVHRKYITVFTIANAKVKKNQDIKFRLIRAGDDQYVWDRSKALCSPR